MCQHKQVPCLELGLGGVHAGHLPCANKKRSTVLNYGNLMIHEVDQTWHTVDVVQQSSSTEGHVLSDRSKHRLPGSAGRHV
jgi:hypothetical protein